MFTGYHHVVPSPGGELPPPAWTFTTSVANQIVNGGWTTTTTPEPIPKTPLLDFVEQVWSEEGPTTPEKPEEPTWTLTTGNIVGSVYYLP